MPDQTLVRTKNTTRFGASVYMFATKDRSKGKTENKSFPGNLTVDLAMRRRQTPSCTAVYDAAVLSMSMVQVRS